MSRPMMRFILAMVAILVGAAIVAALIFIQIPDGNEAVLNVSLGFVLGWGAAVFSFYFGTSESSSQKTELLMQRPTGEVGDPVHVEEDL